MPATKARGPARTPSLKSVRPQLVIRYPRRMRPARQYTAVASWQGHEAGTTAGSGGPFTVRLVLPGTQVVPSERPLDPATPKARATFYVTPLAKGELRGGRLEVLQDGRKVEELALPVRVASGHRPWLLLALAVVIPWFLLTQVQTAPEYAGGAWSALEKGLEEHTPLMTAGVKGAAGRAAEAVGLQRNDFPSAVNYAYHILRTDAVESYDLTVMSAPAAAKAAPADDGLPPADEAREAVVYRLYLPFWVGVTLVGAAAWSCWARREAVGRKVGAPLA